MNAARWHQLTDQELLDRYYEDGNSEWLGILLQRYTMLLYGVCMKYLRNEEEARDGVQQIFLKVIAELSKYRVTYFKSWLYMIARNYCLMYLRDRGRKPLELNEALQHTPLDDEENLLEYRRKDATLNLLEEALTELNADQQKSIRLFYLEKKSYQQIAEETGFSLMQVKSHIQNGKRNLRLLIEKKQKSKL